MSSVEATIVVPTFGRSSVLSRTLARLNAVQAPVGGWEVVVVDDGSADDTPKVIEDWLATAAMRACAVRQDNRGAAAARNRGCCEAVGRVLVFIDNDILVEPDFVQRHLAALASNSGSLITGRIVHAPEIRMTPFGRYRDQLATSFAAAAPEVGGLSGQNLSLYAKDFRRLGGFDERFRIASCEDADLAVRASAAGLRIVHDPSIVVIHEDWAIDLARYCERQRLYSVSDVLLWNKYGERSPRAALVVANQRRSLRNTAKRLLASAVGTGLLRVLCAVVEAVAPDTRLSHRCYEAALAVAIHRGVEEGLALFGSAGAGASS